MLHIKISRFSLVFIATLLGLASIGGCGGGGGGNTVPNTVYFLVAGNAHDDSYILPLTNPQDIAHAREIIANPATADGKIVVAKIERGSGNGTHINKDLIGNRTWSWHVSSFVGFADSTIEILDGWPTYVEENLDSWFENTGGQIGFWSYTVMREVSIDELR